MPKVRPVRSVVSPDEWNISRLQLAAHVSMTTARRYWYGTQDGTETGEALRQIDLVTIAKVAAALGVSWRDLIEDWQALQVATG